MTRKEDFDFVSCLKTTEKCLLQNERAHVLLFLSILYFFTILCWCCSWILSVIGLPKPHGRDKTDLFKEYLIISKI